MSDELEITNGAAPKNTAEQKAANQAQEDAWAEEATWPLWEVSLEGDEAVWAARPGQNLATEDGTVILRIGDKIVYEEKHKEGDTVPWVAKSRCQVTLHAKSEDQAKMIALRAEPQFHTVLEVKQKSE